MNGKVKNAPNDVVVGHFQFGQQDGAVLGATAVDHRQRALFRLADGLSQILVGSIVLRSKRRKLTFHDYQ